LLGIGAEVEGIAVFAPSYASSSALSGAQVMVLGDRFVSGSGVLWLCVCGVSGSDNAFFSDSRSKFRGLPIAMNISSCLSGGKSYT
jgi:hypothetical protein